MPAELINGNEISKRLNAETALTVRVLKEKHGVLPALAVVLAGDDPASRVYVSRKVKLCEELGICSKKIELPQTVTQQELLKVVKSLNEDDSIHGILVQSPPPPQIDEKAIVEAIDPTKDVDCFHPVNVGRVLLGDFSGFLPCTPWGICTLLEKSGIKTAGKHAVILGRSNIVGKPLAALLIGKGSTGDATVTICHSKTRNLPDITRSADILIAAIGKPEFVTADMVSEGVVVIDVGINRIPCAEKKSGFKLVGDVAFPEVAEKASRITPVPGGVGPMTIAMLMKNTIRACRMKYGLASL